MAAGMARQAEAGGHGAGADGFGVGGSIAAIRARYADDVCRSAGVRAHAVRDAFAAVPRERFLGPGPWTIIAPGRGATESDDADPRQLYRNVLVAIDPARGINNGEPKLWAGVFDQLGIATGERVVHVGAGTGYYTAILAEIVGPTGHVTGIEIEGDLAARATAALRPWPQATALCANGFTTCPGPADVVIVNAGASDIATAWLDALADGGRLAVPLTAPDHSGYFLALRRQGDRYPVWFLTGVAIIDCIGGRDPEKDRRLAAAFRGGRLLSALSLHRAPSLPDGSCVLVGEGWWLSSRRDDG